MLELWTTSFHHDWVGGGGTNRGIRTPIMPRAVSATETHSCWRKPVESNLSLKWYFFLESLVLSFKWQKLGRRVIDSIMINILNIWGGGGGGGVAANMNEIPCGVTLKNFLFGCRILEIKAGSSNILVGDYDYTANNRLTGANGSRGMYLYSRLLQSIIYLLYEGT